MSSKFGILLSLIFVIIFFLFGADLIGIQYVYSSLDAKSVTISYYIAKNGYINDEYITYIEDKFDVEFICLNEIYPLYGEVCDFELVTYYSPIVVSNNSLPIRVYRTTVLGYYG